MEVCHLWYEVVLATPRAWWLIYTNAREHQKHLVQYVSTFVQRSKPCLLHIRIEDDSIFDEESNYSDEYDYKYPVNEIISILLLSLSRIRCLSIPSQHLMTLAVEGMPNLVKLKITDTVRDISPISLSHDRFPRLQSIYSATCSWGGSSSLTWFPPLQQLSLEINHRSTWLDVLKNCSSTLKSLSLRGYLEWTERVTITFPLLEYLSFNDHSRRPEVEEWSISMVTPSLISYQELQKTPAPRLRHGDVKSVTHLRTHHIHDLAPFTSLRVLWLWLSGPSTPVFCASMLAEQLRQNINTCPALQLVEFQRCLYREESRIESITRIRSARPDIEVLFTSESCPMPGSIGEDSVGILPSTSLPFN
jgi:hypothetical protein